MQIQDTFYCLVSNKMVVNKTSDIKENYPESDSKIQVNILNAISLLYSFYIFHFKLILL